MIDENRLIQEVGKMSTPLLTPDGRAYFDDAIQVHNETLFDVIQTIKEQPKVNEWISAEQMPKDLEEVLVWFEYFRYGEYNCLYQTYGIGYALNGEWSCLINGSTGWRDLKIIAWMPLPEPYRKKG